MKFSISLRMIAEICNFDKTDSRKFKIFVLLINNIRGFYEADRKIHDPSTSDIRNFPNSHHRNYSQHDW